MAKGGLGVRVSAGVIDSALSSASGFALAIVAANILSGVELGIYGLFFASYTLAMGLPTELVYTAAEIAAIQLPEERRMAVLKRSLRSGVGASLAGAVLTLISIPVLLHEARLSDLIMIAVPTFVAALFGPVEEHIRKIQHSAGFSNPAVASSVTRLVVSVGGVFVLARLGLAPIAVPMTALAAANLTSVCVGFGLSLRRLGFDISHLELGFRQLSSTGRWLLVVGFVPPAAVFLTSTLVTRLAGAEAMGYAEAARAVGQPILVIGVGLLRVLGPRSMEAARGSRPLDAKRNARLFRLLIVAGSVGYLAVTAVPWRYNPFLLLGMDPAYVVPGLVALVVVGNMVISLGFPERSEMLASGMARRVARIEWFATVITLAVAATASVIGAYAWPLAARVAPSGYRVIAYMRQTKSMYRWFRHWGLQDEDMGER